MRLSANDFSSADFQEPFIYERVRGRLVVMTPSGPEHRKAARPFYRELCAYWQQHQNLVDAVDVEGWVATSEHDDRIPDICMYLSGEMSDQDVPHRVPDLIFEFVSTNRSDQERDYIDKREEYHRIRVQEYVIVDRLKRQALVLTWQAGDFAERVLGPADAYTAQLLAGFSIDLAEVLG